MPAVSAGLRMAWLAGGQSAEVDTVAPDMAKVSAAHKRVGRQYPPHGLTLAAMDASFVEAVEQSSQGSAGLSSAPGEGGGVAHPLTSGPPFLLTCTDVNCTFLYMNICTCKYCLQPPPPLHGLFERHVGSPTLQNFLQHCLDFICSLMCWSFFYTAEGVSRNNKTSGHWTGCTVTPELEPVLAL